MNSQELQDHLAWIPHHSVGVFPADQIPKVWTKPTAYIFNTQGHKLPGAHWVCVHVDKFGDGWYFDSYGFPPLVPDHINRLRKDCKRLRWNVRQLQSETFDVCGQYCLMFLHYMSDGSRIEKFLENFSVNLKKNYTIVRNFAIRIQTDETFIGRGGQSNVRCLQSSNPRMSLI